MKRTEENFLLVGNCRYDLPTYGDVLWLENLLFDLRQWGGVNPSNRPRTVSRQKSWSTAEELEEMARGMAFRA